MQLFRLDSSIRTEGSFSRSVADTAEQAWLAKHESGTVLRRDLGANPLTTNAWSNVSRSVIEQSEPSADALALIDELGSELLSSDAFLFAVPMYNWNVPAQVKQWIDLIIAHPVVGIHGTEPLAGKPAILAVSHGGKYSEGSSKEGWDYATPYMVRVLSEVFKLEVQVVQAGMTHAFWNPEMSGLRESAEQSLQLAHEQAAAHGTAWI